MVLAWLDLSISTQQDIIFFPLNAGLSQPLTKNGGTTTDKNSSTTDIIVGANTNLTTSTCIYV